MLFMVIERYTNGAQAVYARAADRGRMLPEGLRYVTSWVVESEQLDHCFQLMETDDPTLFDVWFTYWSDLATFEIFPVITSGEASGRVLNERN